VSITKIFLIRHGETLWNSEQRIQGHIDSQLNPTGFAQAQALAQRLQSQNFAALYSSDLARAYQTAQCLAQTTGLSIEIDQRLRERNLGCFQGLTHSEVQQQFPQEYHRYKTFDPDYIIPNGESFRQFRQRCINCLEELVQKHLGEHILVVSHGGVLVSAFKHILNLPDHMPRRFEIFNISLNVLSYQANNWKLETWGDVSHWPSPK
jgi:probable phosphoglycerate mutase